MRSLSVGLVGFSLSNTNDSLRCNSLSTLDRNEACTIVRAHQPRFCARITLTLGGRLRAWLVRIRLLVRIR